MQVYALSPDTGLADWISALIVQAQPVLDLIIGESGGAILTWTAEVGRSYLVEFKDAVNDPEGRSSWPQPRPIHPP